MPHIVDTHQDAQIVGLQIDDIPLHTGIDIHDAVAADAPVDELILAGMVKAHIARNAGGVALAQVIGLRLVSSAVSDGIALEDDHFLVFVHISTSYLPSMAAPMMPASLPREASTTLA